MLIHHLMVMDAVLLMAHEVEEEVVEEEGVEAAAVEDEE